MKAGAVAMASRLVLTLAAVALAVAPGGGAFAKEGPERATSVPRGAPPRELTDPRALVSPPLAAAAPVPIADLFFLRSSWFGTWSPDGESIVISTDLTGRNNLWKVPARGGFPLQLQQSEDKAFYPAVSPDGRAIVYASDVAGGEIYDLYAIPADGGSPVNLTRSDEASDTGPVFTPDSRAVAFNRRGKTESSTNIALLTLEDRAVRPLTQEKEAGIYWRAVAFTPDGRRLIANRSDAGGVRSSVWSIDVATGAAERLAGELERGYAAASDVSAEGDRIALVVEDAEGRRQAGMLDPATGRTRLLQPGPWPQATTRFSPDGASLLFAANVDGRDEVFLYDRRAAKAERLALPEGVNSDFFGAMPAFSPDGTRILFPYSSGSTPTDWWVYDRAAAVASPLTRLNVASVKPALLPRTQVVHYRSRDGLVISALLWMPFNLQRDGSAPAVVIAHGGPTGQTQDRFDQTAVALASRGYVVIAPNVRGSTGYGRAFEEANRRDLGGGDLEDEANAARFLVQSGYVDPKRIGITGGSYGGYMTVMALAKMPDFWAAGVEQYGIVNWNTMWERGSPALREYQRMLIGDPVKDKAVYAAVSPLTFLGNLRSPLLVLQGENDIRVPKYEAEQIVQRLKANGATVEATYYPGEGHGFLKRENQIDALERTVDWFEQHLKPARP